MSDQKVTISGPSQATSAEKSAEGRRVRTGLFEAVQSRLLCRSTAAVERLIVSAELHDKVDSAPGFRNGLRQKLIQGEIAEDANPFLVQEYFIAHKRYLKIERDLAKGRPKLRSGGFPEELTTLREELVKRFKDGATTRPEFAELLKDSAFLTYVQRMASAMYDGSQLRASEFDKNRFLRGEILEHLATEFRLVQQSEMPPSLRKDHAHKRSVLELNDIYIAASQAPALEGFEKSAARLVVQNSFPSVSAVIERREELIRGAEAKYGNDPVFKPVIGNIARFSLLGTYKSIEAAASAYGALWKESLGIVAGRPELESVQRTLVGLVHQKLYPDLNTAIERYDAVQRELNDHKRTRGDTNLPVDNLTSLILKKSYPSVSAGISRYDEISKQVAEVFKEDSNISGLAGTAASMILERRYKSATEAATALRAILKDCDEILRDETEVAVASTKPMASEPQDERLSYDSSRGTLAWVVFKKKFPSVTAAKQQLDMLTDQAEADIKKMGIASEGRAFSLKRTSARMVLTGVYPSTESAIGAYGKALKVAKEFSKEDSAKNKWRNSIAYVLWTKKRNTAQDSYNFLLSNAEAWGGSQE